VSFLGSIFLWALPLAAAPVILHLLNRRRRQVIRWGAMRLLLESAPRKRRIWQINDLLLMLVRTLAVAAVVLAFAQPQIRSSLFSGKAPGRDVILVVDASLSTGRVVNGAPLLDQIKQRATEVVERLDDSDRVRLMVAASSPHWVNFAAASEDDVTKEMVVQRLSELKPTLATADMPVCVQSALAAEAHPDATGRLIVVVTDGVAHGWGADAGSRWQSIREFAERAEIPTALNVVTVEGPAEPAGNLSVERLSTSRPRVAVGEPFSVTTVVRNTGPTPHEPTVLKWEIDSEPAGESPVPGIEPGQTIDVSFETTCDKPGAFALTCMLAANDEIPGDNASSISVESLEKLAILICRGELGVAPADAQPDFLRAALGRGAEAPGQEGDAGAGTVFDPTVIHINELRGTDLSQFSAVVLDDVLPGSPDVVDGLTDFVQNGGGLWILLGDSVSADQFNAMFYRDGTGLVPAPVGERVEAGEGDAELFTIHPPEGLHPATILLGDTERLDIDDVRIKRRWKLPTPDASEDVAVLLETGDGDPLANEHFQGEGRVIVLGIPCNTKWSNLPVCQAFVPLVQEWVWYLTQPTAVQYNVDPGSPILLPSAAAGDWKEAGLATPVGEEVAFSRAPQSSAAGEDLRYRETAFPGLYTLKVSGEEETPRQFPYWVRRDAGESELAPLSGEQIALLTQAGGARFGVDPLALPENAVESIRYQPFWNLLLTLVVVLFVIEFVFAHVLAKNRYAQASVPDEVVLASPKSYSELRRQPA